MLSPASRAAAGMLSMWGLEVNGPGARFSGGSASESAGGALLDAIPVV